MLGCRRRLALQLRVRSGLLRPRRALDARSDFIAGTLRPILGRYISLTTRATTQHDTACSAASFACALTSKRSLPTHFAMLPAAKKGLGRAAAERLLARFLNHSDTA